VKHTVTVTSRDIESIASAFLTSTRLFTGIDRVYRLYVCDLPYCLRDLDGTPLIETHVFDNQEEAVRWVEEDDRQRRLLHAAEARS
jgi:hypothetical protein